MTEKRRLGRGLGALIQDAIDSEGAEVREVPLSRIKRNPFQPRVVFDQVKLQELAESIKEHGVVQAIVLSPSGENEFLLVAGERRYRAAQIAGLDRIPAVVREFNKSAMLEIALIENLQREDLSPIEEAAAYRKLMEEFGFTQEEMARRIGKSRSAIANTVRLLALPEQVKELVNRGEINAGQARPLLSVTDAETQQVLAAQIMAKGLTAREVERLVSRLNEKKDKQPGTMQQSVRDPLWEDLQANMQHYLGTKVKIQRTKNGGTIEIQFFGDEDLDRLISLLMPGA